MDNRIRILVVDDHAIVREGLKALLGLHSDIDVVAEAESGMECLEIIEKISLDMVLMDLKMPGIDGIQATRLLKEHKPLIKVILLTNYDEEEYVREAIRVGSDGYILKNINKGNLPKLIRNVMQGGAFLDTCVTRKLLNSIQQPLSTEEKNRVRPALSMRELQILEYIVEGLTNREIANIIYLSPATVKTHLKNIYQKLGAHNRSQAASIGLRERLIHLSRS